MQYFPNCSSFDSLGLLFLAASAILLGAKKKSGAFSNSYGIRHDGPVSGTLIEINIADFGGTQVQTNTLPR